MNHIYMAKLIARINRKNWWHCIPRDPRAYQKRGKFYASTYTEAEFWGRPLIDPFRVKVINPFVCDNNTLETILLGAPYVFEEIDGKGLSFAKQVRFGMAQMRLRFALDAKMKRAALALGHDAIVLLSDRGFSQFQESGKMPSSIELNILKP